GVALAPQLGGLEDPGQEALLLGLAAHGHQRRPEEALAEERDPAGGVGLDVLLVEDRLLAGADAPPAVLLGPGQPDPSRRAELALPLHADVPELLVGGAPASADPGE